MYEKVMAVFTHHIFVWQHKNGHCQSIWHMLSSVKSAQCTKNKVVCSCRFSKMVAEIKCKYSTNQKCSDLQAPPLKFLYLQKLLPRPWSVPPKVSCPWGKIVRWKWCGVLSIWCKHFLGQSFQCCLKMSKYTYCRIFIEGKLKHCN